jgi:hypothetical protein
LNGDKRKKKGIKVGMGRRKKCKEGFRNEGGDLKYQKGYCP